ncbi:hypothetical protein LMG28727_01603 [Paraburkholderia kirstenboschensis]|nr:hypothetical protein [Paraburkholderia kirstenboschensis]CAD6521252.1 hypothetical protein LMG28727_01603 [Paraburkholderia kirstenboschensis]
MTLRARQRHAWAAALVDALFDGLFDVQSAALFDALLGSAGLAPRIG